MQIDTSIQIITRHPHYTYDRVNNKLWRTTGTKTKPDKRGRFKIVHAGNSHYYTREQLLELTDYGQDKEYMSPVKHTQHREECIKQSLREGVQITRIQKLYKVSFEKIKQIQARMSDDD